jgi:hypothetical protein
MKESLATIIRRYVESGELVLQLLRESHGISDPLSAYWSGVLPQSGRLSTELGGQYRFHGVGCFFTLNDLRIDIDFEPGQRGVGFDAWRLVRFARETLGQGEPDTKEVEEELARAEERGELVRRGRLYFLPSHSETRPAPIGPAGDGPRE